jgi:DNA sulfur modification protein DndD
MQHTRQPYLIDDAFAESLVELKAQLDRLKLPASTSSQFFEELLEEKECICGRPFDDKSRDVVKQRAELYLAEETSGVLNTLKQDISLHLTDENRPKAATLRESINQLEEYVLENQKAITAVRALTQQLIDGGDEQVQDWQESLEEKQERSEILKELLDDIYRKPLPSDDENTRCLQSLENQKREAERRLAEITGTLELRARTRLLENIVDKALEKARLNLRCLLTDTCNTRLESVLSREPVQIESIDRSLTLRGQEGASVGQTLSVGYTFLTSLLKRGQHQFPLIVDSPANPLSIEVRSEIGSLVPELCEQFLAFTISSERAGFVNALHEGSEGEIKYLTMFRKSPGTSHLLNNLPSEGVTETDNCILIEGKTYFNNFDVEIEDEDNEE